jgi:hypothetical protein
VAKASGKSVAQKLGIKPGFCIFVDGAPSAYGAIVGPLPAGVTVKAAPKSSLDPKPSLDMVHLFAMQSKGLAAKLRRYRETIAPDGMIWVSWPKKSSGVASDLTDVVVRDTALPLGLVDIKVCAIDDTWSGLKFVIPKDQR